MTANPIPVLRSAFRWLLIFVAVLAFQPSVAQEDTTLLPVKTLRIAIHVFQDDSGNGNFSQADSGQVAFLQRMVDYVNHRLANLDTLRPAMPSPFIGDCRVRVRLDTVYYHRDTYAWDCSAAIDATYMRDVYVDSDTTLDYRQKYQTLPVFIGDNNTVVGGHSMGIGDRGFIAVRGYYHSFTLNSTEVALDECGRNLVHELGHCMGLIHNFQGGPEGEQCDNCDDDGCPVQGTSNNIMDLWPTYGYALSKCQFDLIQFYLDGGRGNISEIVINDSCYRTSGSLVRIPPGDTLRIAGTGYVHGDVRVDSAAVLRVAGYLSVPGDCRILMEPGSKLILDGGTLGNLCGDLWQGVEIRDRPDDVPAVIEIVGGGIFENARQAILAVGPAILRLDHAEFRNCAGSVAVFDDPGGTCEIRRASFRITTKLNHYEEGITPGYCILTQGVGRLLADSCRFVNEPGTVVFDAGWMGSGICSDAGCLRVDSCSFTSLTNGISAVQADPGSLLTVTGCAFANNKYAIKSQSAGFQSVTDCGFMLQRFNSGTTVGICLDQPNRFSIQGNRFESVYGGGRQVGILLRDPGIETAPVFENDFRNLPAGVFVDGPPAIESGLISWSRREMPDDSLRLGPQFRFNRFEATDISLAMVSDSTQGIAAGVPGETAREYAIPATAWNTGSFSWYNNQLEMSAFNGWKTGTGPGPLHGWYWFMNFPGSAGYWPQGEEDTNFDSLAVYLAGVDSLDRLAGSEPWPDVYSGLQVMARYPAAARSARLARFWNPFRAEEQPWLTAALASLAGTFSYNDSLLVHLGTLGARANAIRWAASGCNAATFAGLDALTGLSMKDYNLPDLHPFRFYRPGLYPEKTPAFTVYPSPAGEYLFVQPLEGYTLQQPWTGRIVSADGREVASPVLRSWGDQRLSLTHLAPGIYIIEFVSGNQYLGALKFVKIAAR